MSHSPEQLRKLAEARRIAQEPYSQPGVDNMAEYRYSKDVFHGPDPYKYDPDNAEG